MNEVYEYLNKHGVEQYIEAVRHGRFEKQTLDQAIVWLSQTKYGEGMKEYYTDILDFEKK